MKHFTLLTLLSTCLAFSAQAQTNSELSGNRPNTAKTGYVFEFNGTAGYNCPSQIPSSDYNIWTPSYTMNSVGNGSLSITTDGTQASYGRFNLKFTEGDCSPITLDLSSNANKKIEIKLTSTVAVPQLMIQLSDNNGNFADGNPPFYSLVVGQNIITMTAFDFTRYGTSSKVDSAHIQHVSLFFRNSYDDNQSPATTPSVSGTYVIDYIHVGDVSSLVTSSKPAAIESSLEYYPNPASDVLNVKYNYNESSKVVLSDMTGNVVRTETVAAGVTAVTIDTKNIQSGIYLLSIVTKEGTVAKKVVLSGK